MTLEKPAQRRRRYTVLMKRIHDANKLTDHLDSLTDLRTYEKDNSVYTFECKRVRGIAPDVVKWILKLEETNMKVLYEESEWGWNLKKKTSEMTHKMAWYLLAKDSEGTYVGFSHFRFDMDYGSVVLYCYELQLEERIRRVGLGRHIMYLLERIAYDNNMEKVILTVFKQNTSAIDFFTAMNYIKDETSPDEIDKDCFYCILSKPIVNDKITDEIELKNFVDQEIRTMKRRTSKDMAKAMDTSESVKDDASLTRSGGKIVVKSEDKKKVTFKTDANEHVYKIPNEGNFNSTENSQALNKTKEICSLEKSIDDKRLEKPDVDNALVKIEVNENLEKVENDKGVEKIEDNELIGKTKDSESDSGPMELDKNCDNDSLDKSKNISSEIGPMELDKTEDDENFCKIKETVSENGPMELDKFEDNSSLPSIDGHGNSSKPEEDKSVGKIEEDRILANTDDDGSLVKTKDGR